MKNVLIVDDDHKIRAMYSRYLDSEGYKILEASNADDANEILKRKRVDVMLLDIKMPEIDGGVLYNISRMFHAKVKVIVTSVYPVDVQRHLIEGADGYYDKAQGIESLLSAIREVISDETSQEYINN